MRRGEIRYTSGCVPEAGTRGLHGRCWLCGREWYEENCCGKDECGCFAKAESWRDVSYKNVIMLFCGWMARPQTYFYNRWFS